MPVATGWLVLGSKYQSEVLYVYDSRFSVGTSVVLDVRF